MGAFATARLEFPAFDSSGLEKTSGSGQTAVSQALERVASFVPTEVLTLYLALLALFDTTQKGLQWVLTVVCLVLTPLAVLVAQIERKRAVNRARNRAGKPPLSKKPAPWPMIAAPLSFALWVSVLPSSVVASLSFYDRRGALAVLLLGEFALGITDRLLKAREV
jgi:hypothetical protein